MQIKNENSVHFENCKPFDLCQSNLQFKCYSINIQQAIKYTTAVTDSFYFPITVNTELLRTEFENEFQGFKVYETKL